MTGEQIDEAVDWSVANGSVIYFIVRGSQVKIGTTRNLAKRLSELQCGSPDDHFLFGSMPGNDVIERLLHKRWKPHHIRGEWFEFAPEIKAFAKKYRSQRNLSIECACKHCRRRERR